MKSTPSYFAILPAGVRYDKRLKPIVRILYAEITALSNKWGYCTASNGYFSELYDVDPCTISRYISQLKKYEYLKIELDQHGGNARKIYPCDLLTKKSIGSDQTVKTPIDQTVKHNNTSNNNTSNNNKYNRNRADENDFEYVKSENESPPPSCAAPPPEPELQDLTDPKYDCGNFGLARATFQEKFPTYSWNHYSDSSKLSAILNMIAQRCAKQTGRQKIETDHLQKSWRWLLDKLPKRYEKTPLKKLFFEFNNVIDEILNPNQNQKYGKYQKNSGISEERRDLVQNYLAAFRSNPSGTKPLA